MKFFKDIFNWGSVKNELEMSPIEEEPIENVSEEVIPIETVSDEFEEVVTSSNEVSSATFPWDNTLTRKVLFTEDGEEVRAVIQYNNGVPVSNGLTSRVAFFIALSYHFKDWPKDSVRFRDIQKFWNENLIDNNYMSFQSYYLSMKTLSQGNGIYRMPDISFIDSIESMERNIDPRGRRGGVNTPTEKSPSRKREVVLNADQQKGISDLINTNQRASQVLFLLSSMMDMNCHVKANNKRLGEMMNVSAGTVQKAIRELKEREYLEEIRKSMEAEEFYYTYKVKM